MGTGQLILLDRLQSRGPAEKCAAALAEHFDVVHDLSSDEVLALEVEEVTPMAARVLVAARLDDVDPEWRTYFSWPRSVVEE